MKRRPGPRLAMRPLAGLLTRFAPLVRRERLLVGGAFSALLVEVALRLLEPWPLKVIIDHVLVDTGQPSGLAAIDGLPPHTLLLAAAGGFLAITGLRALASYTATVGFALAGNRVLTAVRAQLFGHLQSLSLGFHHGARQGDVLTRVIGDVGLLKDVAVTAFFPLVANVLVLAGMVALMLWLDWRLALLALATLPLFSLTTLRLGRRIKDASRAQRHREGAMAATAAEALGAIRVVQALSLERLFAERFGGANLKSMREGVRATRLSARLERSVDLLAAIATAATMYYGARLVLDRVLTPGDLLVFLSYLKSSFRPMQSFAKYAARLARGSAAAERVVELLDRQPDVSDLPGARSAPTLAGHIRFENVSFDYTPGRPALRDVTFDAPAGARIVLTGPSGSGKSTILALLLRLYDPSEGRGLIDGIDVRTLTLDSLRGQLSVVLQDSLLLAGTVRENIALAAGPIVADEVERAARLANAHDFVMAFPRGYDTMLGERGLTLSAGQRQRLAIARAAARRASLLILDEPTTGLDETNAREVTSALHRVAQGRTTIVATHDLDWVEPDDRVLYVEAGALVEHGCHRERLRAGGRYADLYRTRQARRNAGEGDLALAR